MRWRIFLTNVCNEARPGFVSMTSATDAERVLWTALRIVIAPLLVASLAACAPTIHASGSLQGWGSAPRQTFMLAGDTANDGGAGAAVTRLLEARGFRRAGDAPYRVDVAVSASDPEISLADGARPRQPLSLCRRRRYALSIAMIDKRDGTVLFRRGAETERCGDLSPRLVEQLATVALSG